MSRKIFVIGGAGFIGSVVSKTLLNSHDVVVCDSAGRLRNLGVKVPDSVNYDFGADSPKRISCERGDVAVIFSWRGYPAAHENDPLGKLMINLDHTLKLVTWLVEQGVSDLIYASSGGAVYGDCGCEPVNEATPLKPVGFYGIGKATAEMYIRKVLCEAKVRYIILRIGNAYGPGQIADNLSVGLIAKAVVAACTGRPLELWGTGEKRRDYIHVEDIATAVRTVIDTPLLPAGIYNIGSGKAFSNKEVIAMVRATLEMAVPIIDRSERGFDVGSICLSTHAIHDRTGWRPTWTIEKGIKQMGLMLTS
ncbi:NAD-dependent epimerase/dehydratase family protein [Prosthecobacter fusiformis]|nr:NAD-dependent epimerase/dehydratase family protein [Prosthecobacter fusiformis]